MSGMAPRRGFNESFSMHACIVKPGLLRVEAESSVFHTHRIAKPVFLCTEIYRAFIHICMHGQARMGQCPVPFHTRLNRDPTSPLDIY